jgi:hypothetical protein
MQRQIVTRVLGTLTVALTLTVGVFVGNANAQPGKPLRQPGSNIHLQSTHRPFSTIQGLNSAVTDGAVIPGAAAQGGVSPAWRCGFWSDLRGSYYTHCGSAARARITVETWYGAGDNHDLCVWPGTTRLEDYVGGFITNAWYTGYNCY